MAGLTFAEAMMVVGSATSDFFYTRSRVMTTKNALHIAFTTKGFSGSGQIDAWIQLSNDLENWSFFGATPPSNPIASFSAVGTTQVIVGSVSAGVKAPVGAAWARLAFRVSSGTSISGLFSVRANALHL